MSRVSTVSKQLLLLESADDFRSQTLQICQGARRHLDVLSHHLDFGVFDHPPTLEAISKMARAHRLARVRLLVRDSQPLIDRGHGLVRLAQRLPTKVELRKLVVEPENGDMAFLLCDRDRVIYKGDDNVYRGFVNRDGAAEVQRLRTIFERIWEHAHSEPKLKLLHI